MQQHLTAVYSTLALTILISAVGCYTDMLFHVGGIITTICTFGSMVWLASTNEMSMAPAKRYGLLGAFAFCQVRLIAMPCMPPPPGPHVACMYPACAQHCMHATALNAVVVS